jgi:folylpolyglutamate synthase/dihydropteroate synthase
MCSTVLCRQWNNPITYFEITTVAGLLAFRPYGLYTLLEVGLGGGRPTNVILDPAVTVITR